MFKRLMILGIAAVAFVLGANYLLVYTLNKERERQDRTYWATYTAIEVGQLHPFTAGMGFLISSFCSQFQNFIFPSQSALNHP